jgi:S-formylglutathione hydrolase FrmB
MTQFAVFLALLSAVVAADDAPVISPAARNDDNVLVHAVRSTYQQGTTEIKVLLPDPLKPEHKYPVIYVLPVEANDESRYGNGLAEIKQHNLHNRHDAIFVAPTFSHLPWYADHPTDPIIRQESYFVDVVVPFIDKTYPVQATADGRLLLGFSKSGWGAWCLLLRHPDYFARAAAWDAPLMMAERGKYGSALIFGTSENFDKYRLTDLLRVNSQRLSNSNRLILTGYGNFRADHVQMHALLTELNISHQYRDGPKRKHDWHSGWVPEAVELLLNPAPDAKRASQAEGH